MARTKKPVTPTCYWSRADDDTDCWETACGRAFQFNDGGPSANGFNFCYSCGKRIEIEDSE